MSKIICDVCGTSYPETATQCPICGCVRTADNQKTASHGKGKSASSEYTHVKGGRFSKSNVRKRNHAGGVVSVNMVSDKRSGKKNADKSGNRGLIATAIILLLAIVAVALYITVRYFLPIYLTPESTQPSETESSMTTEATVPCEGVELDVLSVTLEEADATHVILATVTPADTTDTIEFVSADESVATVEADGNQATITAVAPGKTMIIVKCGDLKATCTVECVFENPEDESTEYKIPDGVKLELNRSDMTLSRVGETWDLSQGDIPVSEITWTSKNPAVATIENGVVKAVGNGTTTIYAECDGQKVSCIVRCNLSSGSTSVPGNGGGITEDG